MAAEVRICSRCVCDTTIESIRFDGNGVCNFCKNHDDLLLAYPRDERTDSLREKLIEAIKRGGRGKPYDCVVGISGGTDSCYTLYLAKQLGLRPLAVHFDNGWNTNQSVSNIKAVTNKLGVELETYVVDWEEFKELQISFLKASVPCVEVPTDVAIHATLYRVASAENVRYILGGQSFCTEGTVPREWSYIDGTYVKSVQKRFGQRKLRSYPNLMLSDLFYYTFVKRIRNIPFLNYFDYSKYDAKKMLTAQFGWQDYGGHHYENLYSKFAFGWYLPKKFNIDKRKVSLSGPVRSGHLSRSAALEQLGNAPEVNEELVQYVINKLGLSEESYERFFNSSAKSYKDYFTSEDILRHFKLPIQLSVRAGIFTPVLYKKYFE